MSKATKTEFFNSLSQQPTLAAPRLWRRSTHRDGDGPDELSMLVDEIKLADGRRVLGILYPRELAEGRHRDISDFGDWRAYMSDRSGSRSSR